MLHTFDKESKLQKRKEARQRQMRVMEEAASGALPIPRVGDISPGSPSVSSLFAAPVVARPPSMAEVDQAFDGGGSHAIGDFQINDSEDEDDDNYDDRHGRGDFVNFLGDATVDPSPASDGGGGGIGILGGGVGSPGGNHRVFMNQGERKKEVAESHELIKIASQRVNRTRGGGAGGLVDPDGLNGLNSTVVLDEYDREYGYGAGRAEDAGGFSSGGRWAGHEGGGGRWRISVPATCVVYRRFISAATIFVVLLVVLLAMIFATTLPKRGDADHLEKFRVEGNFGNGGGGSGVEDAVVVNKFMRIKDRLLEHEISRASDLENPNSPQYKALMWIVRDDPRKLDVELQGDDERTGITGPELDAEWSLFQRYALAVLWFASTSPTAVEQAERAGGMRYSSDRKNNGTHMEKIWTEDDLRWDKASNWMSDKGICLWHGVTCYPYEQLGENFDGDFHVAKLNLTTNNIHGVLPRETVSALHKLKTLDLSQNVLEGTVPEELGKLKLLEDLYLSSNRLSGAFPSVIGNCENLYNLHVSDNRFKGRIPYQLGNCRKLRDVSLFDNFFFGEIPASIKNLKELLALYLDVNDLDGQIPETISQLTKLIDLRLRRNSFTGTIPTEIGTMELLEVLYLDTNSIGGSIPSELSKLQHLDELHLYQNDLIGTLPPELGSLNNLVFLYIDSNELTGTIPMEWGQMSGLEELFIHSNSLKGTIPQTIRGMVGLKKLRANDNDFTGSIPSDLGKLFKLELLYLDENEFFGEVPGAIGQLTKLKELKLHDNEISGEMPAAVCNLVDSFFLQKLTADCSKITCPCCTCP